MKRQFTALLFLLVIAMPLTQGCQHTATRRVIEVEGVHNKGRSPEFNSYARLLIREIKRDWKWTDRGAELAADIKITIDPDGTITSWKVVKPSSDSTFDRIAIEAVKSASPVTPPPPHLYKYFTEVLVTFDPRK